MSIELDSLRAILLSIIAMRCSEGNAEVKVSGVNLSLSCMNWHETNRKLKKFVCAVPRIEKLYWYNQIDALLTQAYVWTLYMVFECGRVLCGVWETRY